MIVAPTAKTVRRDNHIFRNFIEVEIFLNLFLFSLII